MRSPRPFRRRLRQRGGRVRGDGGGDVRDHSIHAPHHHGDGGHGRDDVRDHSNHAPRHRGDGVRGRGRDDVRDRSIHVPRHRGDGGHGHDDDALPHVQPVLYTPLLSGGQVQRTEFSSAP